MGRTHDPQAKRPRRLHLVPTGTRALPPVVPLLSPVHPATPAQEAMLNALGQRARLGDRDSRELLWRAFAPRLEPAMRRCGRLTWQAAWARRNGRPWELDDLRQEGWLVFVATVEEWSGEGSVVSYVTASFPWRLRNVLRRLGPPRLVFPLPLHALVEREREPVAECPGLHESETAAILEAIMTRLSPEDRELLRLRVAEGATNREIATRLRLSRRAVVRRWVNIRRLVRAVLDDPSHAAPDPPPAA